MVGEFGTERSRKSSSDDAAFLFHGNNSEDDEASYLRECVAAGEDNQEPEMDDGYRGSLGDVEPDLEEIDEDEEVYR